MTKITITHDEYWPYRVPSESKSSYAREIDPDTFKRWQDGLKAFDRLQEEMKEWEEAQKKP